MPDCQITWLTQISKNSRQKKIDNYSLLNVLLFSETLTTACVIMSAQYLYRLVELCCWADSLQHIKYDCQYPGWQLHQIKARVRQWTGSSTACAGRVVVVSWALSPGCQSQACKISKSSSADRNATVHNRYFLMCDCTSAVSQIITQGQQVCAGSDTHTRLSNTSSTKGTLHAELKLSSESGSALNMQVL